MISHYDDDDVDLLFNVLNSNNNSFNVNSAYDDDNRQ